MELAILGIVAFLVLMLLGMNIGVALLLVGAIGYSLAVSPTAALGLLRTIPTSQAGTFSLMVIPMFIIMGNFAFAAGLSGGLYDACNKWLSRLPGNLACGTMMASAGFGTICGSIIATTATMGTIAIPEMRKHNYSTRLATGTVAMGGTMGNLIPPSTLMIIYCIVAEQSIGRLFAAIIIPGIITAVLAIFTIVILVLINPGLAPPPHKTPWIVRIKSLTGVIPVVVVFLIVLGGMFSGFFTVNQAACLGALTTAIILAVKGRFTWKTFTSVMAKSIQTSAMTFLILIGATVFCIFLNITGFPVRLASIVGGFNVPPYVILIFMTIAYFTLGAFMDELPMLVMTIPVFLPIILNIGYDAIWFGVYAMLCMDLGSISPPVGLTCFIIAGVAEDVPLTTIFLGALPFVGTVVVAIVIVSAFPGLCTFLPNLLFSR